MEKGGGTQTLYIVNDYPRFFRSEATQDKIFQSSCNTFTECNLFDLLKLFGYTRNLKHRRERRATRGGFSPGVSILAKGARMVCWGIRRRERFLLKGGATYLHLLNKLYKLVYILTHFDFGVCTQLHLFQVEVNFGILLQGGATYLHLLKKVYKSVYF